MASISAEEANAIIQKIMVHNGGIDEETRRNTPMIALEALDSVRKKLAAATSTLAKELYSKDTRFVFELIQNAEDNRYKIATAAGARPFLKFLVSTDKMQVDSNEDGFSAEDVKAICSVGESTKSTTQGYIGEKGIGFKSVFKLASRVKIQSGPFCFSFRNGKEDDGLGMVTPYSENPESLPLDIRTRITLTLHDPFQYSQRVKDFEQMPETLPLFLTQLKDIVIIFNSDHERKVRSYSYDFNIDVRIGELKIASTSNSGTRTSTTKRYHVIKRNALDLPAAEARSHTKQAEVILAFPIDTIRKDGFNFIIQSDFITQASREDIVHNPWNEALRDHVAHAFKDAVLRFGQDEELCSKWMRYLPNTTVSDFWAPLGSTIVSLLGCERIMKPWSGGMLKLPPQLKYVGVDCLDENKEPLFRDLSDEIYLSRSYLWRDFHILKEMLSVTVINWGDIYERVESDLARADSYMKGTSTSTDWHSRSARLLRKIVDSTGAVSSKVRSLSIIPLQDGNGISVPTDLGLGLVDKAALENEPRKELFAALGVNSPLPFAIVNLTIWKYNGARTVTLGNSIAHLRYLYYFSLESQEPLDKRIYLFSQTETPIYRAYVPLGKTIVVDDLYFETDDEFGVKNMCAAPPMASANSGCIYPVHFIHPSYLNAVPTEARVRDRSWISWLRDVAEVRQVPRLSRSSDPTKLTPISEAIVSKSPGKVVGWLHKHWKDYYDATATPDVLDTLRRARVSCQGSSSEEDIEDTYLPTTRLKDICAKLSPRRTPVPFFEVPPSMHMSDYSNLRFLAIFGVDYEPCLDFYLDILENMTCADHLEKPLLQSIREVYEGIERYSKTDDYERIRTFFKEETAVYIPGKTEDPGKWVDPSDCVWKAPDFLDEKHSLAPKDIYGQSNNLRTLFVNILEIRDAEWQDYLCQLKAWTGVTTPRQNVKDAYKMILEDAPDDCDWNTICSDFETNALIYLSSHDQWYPRSSCLWTDQTIIPGKAAIKLEYPQLSEFFLKKLGIKKPSLELYVKELIALCGRKKEPPHCEVRDLIQEINACKPNAEQVSALKPMNFLPVKDVDKVVRLRSTSDMFTVLDLQEHETMFQGLVATLDYNIEEVHNLWYLIDALGLRDNLSSAMASESSSAKDSSKSVKLTEEFQRRAYALFRCAAHYKHGITHSKDDPLYNRLLHTEVYTSEDIVKTIKLGLNGNVLATRSGQGTFHLHEDETMLRLYIPHNHRLQELCYITQIPKRLALQFTTTDAAAEKAIGDIFKSSLAILDDVLVNKGIIRVLGVEPMPDLEEPRPNAVPETGFQFGHISEFQDNVSILSDGESTVIGYNDLVSEAGTSARQENNISYRAPRSSSNTTESQIRPTSRHDTPPVLITIPRNREYPKLLSQVIEAAGRINFPQSQTMSRASTGGLAASTLSLESCFGTRAESPLEHDIKIGAAGELFVFEFFFLNNLPGFGIDNWKSSIRHHVNVHERYRQLTAWRGAETADIVYDDMESELTSALIGCGYLDRTTWTGQRPRYYLEVKTTTGDCDTRFYASKAQYKRTSPEIYVIFRVFNLGEQDIGLRIMVDPKGLERRGELEFEADTYTVFQRFLDEEEEL